MRLGVLAVFLLKPFLPNPFSHLETTRDRIPHWTNGYIGILRAGRDLPTENVAKQVSLGISIQGGWGIPGAQDYSPNQSGVRGQLQ